MAHRLDDFQFHDLACQQPQRPVVITFWRRPKSRRYDSGLLVPRQQLLHRWLLTLNSVERLFESLLDEPLPKSFNGSRPTGICLGNTIISPVRSIGVGLQQNLGTSNLLTSPLQLLDNTLKLNSFLLRQTNH